MNTFLIIALCLILIFQVGIFLVACAIWVERSPVAKPIIDTLHDIEKLSKQVDGAVKSAKGWEAHTHSAVYHINKDKTADVIKKVWDGAEAAEKIKRGDTAFRTERITVYNPPKKAAKKPAKKTQSKKPVKRTRK